MHYFLLVIVDICSRGDIQPFTQLGLRLQQDGHRVRIATHAMFRSYVTDRKLEFFPLAGDPVALSEFMVKTQGFIIPTTPEMLLEVRNLICQFWYFNNTSARLRNIML